MHKRKCISLMVFVEGFVSVHFIWSFSVKLWRSIRIQKLWNQPGKQGKVYHGKSFNLKCANGNKSRLLFSSAEMFKKPLWQTVWIHAVCFYTFSNARKLLAADHFNRRHFQMHFFLALLQLNA